jgi:DNA-directed RNA polymerase subunit RPC12/RpoP
MFNRPSCPNCGSNYLVVKMRTHGYPRTETKKQKRYYKCFRCFESFTPKDSDPAVPETNIDL